MSFILDALKKSDNKRQTTAAPRLDTVHDSAPVKSRRRGPLIGLALLGLCLAAGLLLWLTSSGSLRQESEPLQVKTQPIPAQPRSVPAAASSPTTATASPQPQLQRATAEPVPSPSVETPPTTTDSLPVTQSRTYAIEELPLSVRGQLPELHMSLHAYSKENAAASLVRVNNLILREGTLLADKYLLEEITADGAVFSYRGYRFVLPRKRS